MLAVGDAVQIAGCSTKKRILETSSGCESFDSLLGGALSNSSIVLIDEVFSQYHGKFLNRAFLAEGEFNKHVNFVAGPRDKINQHLIEHIPMQKAAKNDVKQNEGPNENMQIAWRYEKIGKVDSGIVSGAKKEIQFDYGNPISEPTTKVLPVSRFSDLYEKLYELLTSTEHVKGGSRAQKKSLLRLVVQNVADPRWEDRQSLPKFLVLLRKLLRNSYAVVYLYLNSVDANSPIVQDISSYCDVHVQLQQFNDAEAKEMKHLGGANGFFRLIRLPRLASVGMHVPPIVDLVFETSSTKGFQIRILHLPPALGDDQEKKTNSCNIDF